MEKQQWKLKNVLYLFSRKVIDSNLTEINKYNIKHIQICIAVVSVIFAVVLFGFWDNHFKLSRLASQFLSSCLSLQIDDFPGATTPCFALDFLRSQIIFILYFWWRTEKSSRVMGLKYAINFQNQNMEKRLVLHNGQHCEHLWSHPHCPQSLNMAGLTRICFQHRWGLPVFHINFIKGQL